MLGRPRPLGLDYIQTDVWRVGAAADEPVDGAIAALIHDDRPSMAGHSLYLSHGPIRVDDFRPCLELPVTLNHIEQGDVIGLSRDGRRLDVLWKAAARHNSILLTEQCNHYCLMCSQPPKERDDSWLYGRAARIVDLINADSPTILLTGGEPTLQGDALLALLAHIGETQPKASIHLLTNGRRFADISFTNQYAAVEVGDLMAGIPLYAPEPAIHDYIVQASGAFNETVRGILNLCAAGRAVEIRVVVQRHNVAVLPALADFIARNLPFISQVALMALEMTGLARPNASDVWIDPAEHQAELAEAVHVLANAGVPVRLYNFQLCILAPELHPYAVRSISDWKNEFIDICQTCSAQDQCAGLFSTSNRHSQYLHAI